MSLFVPGCGIKKGDGRGCGAHGIVTGGYMGASGHRDLLSLFGCHITVIDMASGSGLENEGGDGLVGHCCGCSWHGSGHQSG